MKGNYQSRWNNANTYRTKYFMNAHGSTGKATFCYRTGEITEEQPPRLKYNKMQVNEMIEAGKFDALCVEIICRIAASKYLTFAQLLGFLTRQGIEYSMNDINKKMKLLVKCGFLRVLTCRIGEDTTLKCYCISNDAQEVAIAAGVPIHKGNRCSTQWLVQCGVFAEDEPYEIKRILEANQIVLSLFGCSARFERFGIMETLTLPPVSEQGYLVRTTCNVSLDKEDTLMYEVVRKMPEWKEKTLDKILRFAKMVYSPMFLEENRWGLCNYPQLVICGESQSHNAELYNHLKDSDVFRDYPQFSLLFTCDNIVRQAPEMMYAYDENGDKIWYAIPIDDFDRNAA